VNASDTRLDGGTRTNVSNRRLATKLGRGRNKPVTWRP